MHPIIEQNTPAAPVPLAVPQQTSDTDLMRRTDAVKSAHFAKLRLHLALESGQSLINRAMGVDGKRVAVIES